MAREEDKTRPNNQPVSIIIAAITKTNHLDNVCWENEIHRPLLQIVYVQTLLCSNIETASNIEATVEHRCNMRRFNVATKRGRSHCYISLYDINVPLPTLTQLHRNSYSRLQRTDLETLAPIPRWQRTVEGNTGTNQTTQTASVSELVCDKSRVIWWQQRYDGIQLEWAVNGTGAMRINRDEQNKNLLK